MKQFKAPFRYRRAKCCARRSLADSRERNVILFCQQNWSIELIDDYSKSKNFIIVVWGSCMTIDRRVGGELWPAVIVPSITPDLQRIDIQSTRHTFYSCVIFHLFKRGKCQKHGIDGIPGTFLTTSRPPARLVRLRNFKYSNEKSKNLLEVLREACRNGAFLTRLKCESLHGNHMLHFLSIMRPEPYANQERRKSWKLFVCGKQKWFLDLVNVFGDQFSIAMYASDQWNEHLNWN